MEERRLENTTVVISILALQSQKREGVEHPQCVICCKVLAAECMLPSKLKRYLTTNHNNLSEKPYKYFARKSSEMNKQSVLFSNFLHTPAKTQIEFLKVAYRIAKCKKPRTIAEELVLAVSCSKAKSCSPLKQYRL